MARVRTLVILPDHSTSVNPIVMSEMNMGLCRMPAPNLRELLVFHSGENINDLSFRTSMSVLEDYVGEEQAIHNLRILALKRMVVSATMLRMLFSAQLSTLHLTNCHCWRNVDEMIETLEATPMLELFQHHLDASFRQHTIFRPSRSTKYPLRHVQLPRLRKLSLSGDKVFAMNIVMFSYLETPSTATLSLRENPRSVAVPIAEVSDFIDMGRKALREHFAPAIAHGALYETLIIGNRLVFAPAGSDELLLPGKNRSPEAELLTNRFEFSIPAIEGEEPSAGSRPAFDLLLDMTIALPIFRGVTRLSILDDFRSYTAAFFRRFPHLVSLILHGDDPFVWAPFPNIICAAAEDGQQLLPKLRGIVVTCPRSHGTNDPPRGNEDAELFEKFAAAILARWGEDFEIFGIRRYTHDWEDGAYILGSLADELGLDRLRCWAETVDGHLKEIALSFSDDDSSLDE
ncbi:unnamed protein product [Peniophora sp. CBMAI 1063]|nr:unnamed protein product [Peniophora sp. CBMAI 1063]